MLVGLLVAVLLEVLVELLVEEDEVLVDVLELLLQSLDGELSHRAGALVEILPTAWC